MGKGGLPALVTTLVIALCFIAAPLSSAAAGESPFTQEDRELLIRLDKRLNQIDKRFEQVDKRFEFVIQMMMARGGALRRHSRHHHRLSPLGLPHHDPPLQN